MRYETGEQLAAYTRGVHGAWGAFLLDAEAELDARDPEVATPRGRLRFSDLLASQRWHVSFHHRQIVEFLEGQGLTPAHPFRVEQLRDLTLPGTVT